MSGLVQAYLFFEGRCEEALAFYAKAIGAKRGELMRYRDNPEPQECPAGKAPPGDKVMHGEFTVGESTVMVSDGMASGTPSFAGFGLTLNASTPNEAQVLFDALADGGRVVMPMGKTFYSPAFGMVHDRFGVMWMVIVPQ